MRHHPNNNMDDKQDIKGILPLNQDNKRLLEILELVESQYKLATKHYELWKNLLNTLAEDK